MAFQDHFEIILQRVPFFFFLGLRLTYLPNPWSDFGILRPPCHAVLHGGAHLARITVQAAIASGSIVQAVSIINSVGLGAIVFYGDVEEYRELNHLD